MDTYITVAIAKVPSSPTTKNRGPWWVQFLLKFLSVLLDTRYQLPSSLSAFSTEVFSLLVLEICTVTFRERPQ